MSGDGSVIPVRVAVRIRPLSKKEHGDGCNEALDKPLAGRPQVVFRNCNDKAFTYDYAYGPATKQHELFQEAVHPLVDQLFKGKWKYFELPLKNPNVIFLRSSQNHNSFYLCL